ncbi:hypothetical protein QKT49_gp113 [Acanthamoeba castellanii medusavirus]|uniref:Uncharacterized protein n=1 Tax=Acanthamoeba castellanii medusavirus J1 TaxID=3114988 RepID=A0A3T1CWP8_9VIRU|nr:hypothetical protein QKT49_gp113 [Acanthamoeba castellanii medusavirus]BBI30253.1 hypothetical protein [Acanthamoeba castellanii medusavirus J1]
MSCLAKANQSANGYCKRSDAAPIEAPDCDSKNDTTKCNAHWGGKDGSTWCAEDAYGCCYRLTPPANNIVPCCLGQKTSFQDCGDDWCPLSPACQATLGEYCGKSADNVVEPLCQTFCSFPENKHFCDAAMTEYCAKQQAAGVRDPLCTCIWAAQAGTPAPSCFSAACTATGYMTDEQFQASLTCPTYCPQVVSCLNSGKCTTSNNLVETHCCSADYPELCSGGSSGLIGWWERWVDRYLPTTQSKIVGGTMAALIVCTLLLIIATLITSD